MELERLGIRPLLSCYHLTEGDLLCPQIMLEEFGKYPENRDRFFSDVYNAVLASAMTGGPLKGVAFWQWYDDGQVRYPCCTIGLHAFDAFCAMSELSLF